MSLIVSKDKQQQQQEKVKGFLKDKKLFLNWKTYFGLRVKSF